MIDGDDKQCASCSLDGTIIIWSLKRHQILQKESHITIGVEAGGSIFNMVYIPLTHNIACIDSEKKISYINLDSLKVEK